MYFVLDHVFYRWVRENVPGWEQAVVCSPDEERSPADHVTSRAGILKRVMGGKIHFWN
jgi:hypothetical protein